MSKYEFLINLAQTYPSFNISVIRYPLELLHHFKYMQLADATGQIYLPTPKQTSFDAYLLDKESKDPSLSIEYKFIESNMNYFGDRKLSKLVDKYGLGGSNIDKIDIGFRHEEPLHKQFETLSSFHLKKMEHISFEMTDFSSFFHSQYLTTDFETTAETLFKNQCTANPQISELTANLFPL